MAVAVAVAVAVSEGKALAVSVAVAGLTKQILIIFKWPTIPLSNHTFI